MTKSLFQGTLSAIKESSVVDQHHSTRNLVRIDESALVNGVYAAIRKNQALHENRMKLYRIMTETTNIVTIHEGFADYAAQASDITEQFLKFVTSKVEDRMAAIDEIVESAKVVNDNLDILAKIKSYDADDRDGYHYIFPVTIPNLTCIDMFNASLFEELVQKQWTDLSADAIRLVLESIDLEAVYRKARASILELTSKTDGLSEAEFEFAIHLVFRGGAKEAVELRLDAESIHTLVEKWKGHRQYYTNILQNDLKRVKASIEGVMDKIEAICRSNNGLTLAAFTNLLPGDLNVQKVDGKDVSLQGMRISADMMVQLDLFCKLKLDQLQQYTDFVCMTLLAKADAMHDCLIQNAKLMTDCIDVIRSNPETYSYLLKKEG